MRAIFIIGAVLVAARAGLRAQDTISVARDLYASAAYEEALSTLSRMDGATAAPDVARQVDEYRAFCLYALGRTREAESIAESMVRKHPAGRIGRRRVAAPRKRCSPACASGCCRRSSANGSGRRDRPWIRRTSAPPSRRCPKLDS